MKELSMHILDISQNSVRAEAKNVIIEVIEKPALNIFEFIIEDDGSGIPKEIYDTIKNPFTTSRTMRKVGLGIPLLDDTCRLCNGELILETKEGIGTKIKATMDYDSIDRPPLGDIISTMAGLITSNGDINIKYVHIYNEEEFDISTNEIKEALGDVPLTEIEVYKWLKNFIKENLEEIKK